MKETVSDIISTLVNIADNMSSEFPEGDQAIELVKKTTNDIKKVHGGMYTDKLSDVRKAEAEHKMVTSVAIHQDNLKFIEELQAEAKEQFFCLTKENIINLALLCLCERYSSVGDVFELVDSFY